jgi:glycosyltransferase involved in cell wall biosynthesis
MICGKPVLVSDCKPLKRIVEQANAGAIFRANDEKNLAKTLLQMAAFPEVLIEMGKNGQKAALGPLSWKKDAQLLVDMYRQFELLKR